MPADERVLPEQDAPDAGTTAPTIRPLTEADAGGARRLMFDVFYRDFGYGYVPDWHADVIDLERVYLHDPRHVLYVALYGGEVVGTAGIRAKGPNCPPHPAFLGRRYPNATTAELCRVYVHPEQRRRGLARRLVHQACAFAATIPGYATIWLHTDAKVPGSKEFWRSMATLVHDGRGGPDSQAVHFEIPLET